MKNIVYGLIYLNDLKGVLLYWSETEGNTLFEEGHIKNILKVVEIVLEGLYVLVIFTYKGISVNDFCATAYIGICTTSVISRAWQLYKSVYEERKMKTKIRGM